MKPETPSYSGELKMVKVRRGKRGQKKSGSLVFRILRTSKTVSDDSGIKVSSSSEDESKLQESPSLPLQLKRPRLLFKEGNQNESGISECGSPGDLMQQNKDENEKVSYKSSSMSKCSWPKDSTLLHEDSADTHNLGKCCSPENSVLKNEGEEQDVMDNDYIYAGVSSCINVPNLGNSSPENSDVKNEDDQDVLSRGLGVHNMSERSSPEDSVSQNKDEDQEVLNDCFAMLGGNLDVVKVGKARPLSKLKLAKSYDLRSSSRRIFPIPSVKKSSQSESQNLCPGFDSKIEAQPNSRKLCENKLPLYYECSRNSVLIPGTPEKKRRRKRNGANAAEVKKRKYGRPGRPPKSIAQSDFCTDNSEYDVSENRKKVLQLPKNSVWTLVPKELFKSEFFKSQVIKIRHPNPVKRSTLNMPSCYSPYPVHKPPSQYRPALPMTNKRVQLKFPKFMLSRPPAVQQVPPGVRDKRPTVIYFNSERNGCDDSHSSRTPVQPEVDNTSINTDSMSIQNDVLYLCNKYPVLDSAVVKKCYDLTKGDVNETDCILADLLSRNSSFILAEKCSNTDSVNYLESCPVFDVGSNYSCNKAVPHPTETPESSSYLPSFDDVDTLSRNILIESILILYSEESVLQ